MSAREGAPAEHRRQLERGKPDPNLPRLKIHCATCDEMASVFQVDEGGQFLSYWDGYRWYALAATCSTHGRLRLDPRRTLRAYQEARDELNQVAHCWVYPDGT